MKSIVVLTLLITISACGVRKTSENVVKKNSDSLVCSTPDAVIKVDQEIVDKIMIDLQDRPFHRNSFWNIISRENRLAINLALMSNPSLPEEIVYRGFVMFMENYVNNPDKNYSLKTSHYSVRFVIHEELDAETQATCGQTEKALEKIDISRLIPAASEEQRLRCVVDSSFAKHDLGIRLFRNHLIIETERETTLFAGAEIIRNEENPEIRITALDPKQRMLTLKLEKNEDQEKKRKVAIRFSGKTTSLEGNGTCFSLQK